MKHSFNNAISIEKAGDAGRVATFSRELFDINEEGEVERCGQWMERAFRAFYCVAARSDSTATGCDGVMV